MPRSCVQNCEKVLGVGFLYGVYRPGNELELIFSGKNGNYTSRTGMIRYWISVDLKSLRGYDGLKSRKTLKKKSFICIFWEKTTPYGENFKILFHKDGSLLRGSRPKSARASSEYSKCSRFHSNRFCFAGGIPGRVITVKTGPPIFGWSLASNRTAN